MGPQMMLHLIQSPVYASGPARQGWQGEQASTCLRVRNRCLSSNAGSGASCEAATRRVQSRKALNEWAQEWHWCARRASGRYSARCMVEARWYRSQVLGTVKVAQYKNKTTVGEWLIAHRGAQHISRKALTQHQEVDYGRKDKQRERQQGDA